jgi:putative transposase
LKVEGGGGGQFVRIDSPKTILRKDTTAVKKPYHIVSREAETASATLEEFAKANGQILLPLVELITQARVAVDEVIDHIGRRTIEKILNLSAEQVAGARTPGKSSGEIRWHGSQNGRVSLADRQIKVKRLRLRHKQDGEVSVPAYESLQENGATAQRMMGALLRGVSTREYAEVLPEMAETAGVSRSSISRQAIEGSVEQLRQLRERHWEEADLLVLYLDGQRFGSHHVISAGGSGSGGVKHVLGLELGATENAAAVKQLFTHLRDQGLPMDRKYLFVIDGAKALRAAIEEVFGTDQPVQRCRNHKMRNVIDELPQEQQAQAMNLMRAAWRVSDAEEGVKRLEQLARFLEHEHESAARSLREA